MILQHFKQPLICFELHVCYVLILQPCLVLVLSSPLSLLKLLFRHSHLLLSETLLPVHSVLKGILNLPDVVKFSQSRHLLEPDAFL